MTILYQEEIIASIDSAIALICPGVDNIHTATLDIVNSAISKLKKGDDAVQRISAAIRAGYEDIPDSVMSPLDGVFGTFVPEQVQETSVREMLLKIMKMGGHVPIMIGLGESDVNKKIGVSALFTMKGPSQKLMLVTMNLRELYAQALDEENPKPPADGVLHFVYPLLFQVDRSGYTPVSLYNDRAVRTTFFTPMGERTRS